MYKLTWTIPVPDSAVYVVQRFELLFKKEDAAIRYKKRLVRAYKLLWFNNPSTYVRINKVDVF